MRSAREIKVVHVFAGSGVGLLPSAWARVSSRMSEGRFVCRFLVPHPSTLSDSAGKRLERAGGRIIVFPALGSAGDWTYDLRLRFSLGNAFREFRPDLIHVHGPSAIRAVRWGLSGFPETALIYSLDFDEETEPRGLAGKIFRWSLRRQLSASRRIVARDDREQRLVETAAVARRYQLETLELGLNRDDLRDARPEPGIPELLLQAPRFRQAGVYIPDVERGPLKRMLFSLRGLFDLSPEVGIWCCVPMGQLAEIRKTLQRLRFPEGFHLTPGLLNWEWLGSRIGVAWIPGDDAESDFAATLSQAFGVPVVRSDRTKSEARSGGGRPLSSFGPASTMERLRDALGGDARDRRGADLQVASAGAELSAASLAACYRDVLGESRGGVG